MAELADLGISIDDVTGQLLREGLRLFAEPFAKLLSATARGGHAGQEGVGA